MPAAFQHLSKRSHAALSVICFPYAGAMGFPFHSWPARLPASVEIFAAQLPGHGSRMREPLLQSLPEVVDHLSPELPVQGDRPFVFFGHSMGALVAFELTRRLRETGRTMPRLLVASACSAPDRRDRIPRIYDLPDAAFLEGVRTLNGIPDQAIDDPEFLSLMLPILRADMTATQTYIHHVQAPLPCPIAAIGGTDDPGVAIDTLDAWRAHTHADFSRQLLPGGHFYTQTAERQFLAIMTTHLESILSCTSTISC